MFDKAQRAQVVLAYLRGYDPVQTYRALWPKTPPITFAVYQRLYVDEVVRFHSPQAEERRVGLDGEDQKSYEQLTKVRDLLFEALETCVNEPLVVECEEPLKQFDRTRLLAGLANAHGGVVKTVLRMRKQQIETAAAMHSLLASRQADDDED